MENKPSFLTGVLQPAGLFGIETGISQNNPSFSVFCTKFEDKKIIKTHFYSCLRDRYARASSPRRVSGAGSRRNILSISLHLSMCIYIPDWSMNTPAALSCAFLQKCCTLKCSLIPHWKRTLSPGTYMSPPGQYLYIGVCLTKSLRQLGLALLITECVDLFLTNVWYGAGPHFWLQPRVWIWALSLYFLIAGCNKFAIQIKNTLQFWIS